MRVFFEFGQLPSQFGQSKNRVRVTSRNSVIREFIHDFTADGWLDNPRPPSPQPNAPIGAPWTDMSGALLDNGFVLNLDAQGWPWPRANKRFSLVIDAESCPDPEFSIDVYNLDGANWRFAVSASGNAGIQFSRYEYDWQWYAGPSTPPNQTRIVQLEMQSKTIIVR